MAESSDAELIAASGGDPVRFGEIFDRHGETVLRFLVRRVGPEAAESLLGEVFRIGFERRGSFDRARSSARPWLYGIASNVLFKHRRSEARRLRASARLAADGRPEAGEDQVIAGVDARSLWRQVAHAISALPDGERDAMLLFAWEDLSYADVGEALEVPVGTIRSRIHRARGRLRELVGGSGEQQVETARPGPGRYTP